VLLFLAAAVLAAGVAATLAQETAPAPADPDAPETPTREIIDQALKEKRIIESLRTIDGRYRQFSDELEALRAEEKRLTEVIADNRRQVERTRLEHEIARRSAGERLIALYKLYRGSALEYLFSAEGALDFVRRYRYALYVVRGDVDSIDRYAQSLAAMNRQHEALTARQKEIADLADRIDTRRRQADATRRQHREVLAAVRSDQRLFEIEAEERARSTQEVRRRLLELATGGGRNLRFAEMRGYLDPPVHGTILESFGRKVHSRFKTVTFNRGIDIAAPAGAPVRVVFDGEVQLIQDFLAYGRMVIVDHGDRYHSLYAPIEDPRVKPGQTVRRGEIIGLVGQTATQEQPLLHLEIRHQGKAQDPGEWLFLPKGR
jgi:murein hydrolase activator